MKILTGDLRGRTLAYKPNPHLRPTADKTRKAIFDMLQGQLKNTCVLDLFSGTGALGFEALSQGANFVTFVEMEKTQGLIIKNNLEKLGLLQQSEVIIGDALRTIEKLSYAKREFDFIFIDPPYEKGLGQRAMTALAESAIVKKDAFIVLESRGSEDLSSVEKYFTCLRNKIYGDTRVVIYRCVQGTG